MEDGKEMSEGEKFDASTGALEVYNFVSVNDTNIIKIRRGSAREWEDYFLESWLRLLVKLKVIFE